MTSKIYSLYDLAEWKNGLAFRKFDFSDTGKPVIKIAELKNGITASTAFTNGEYGDAVKLQKGDMLFSWSGNPDTSIDVFWYSLPDGWLNQHIFKITPKSIVDRKYLYYLLKYLKPQFTAIASNKQTTGLGHVTVKDLKEIFIELPSLSIQESIGNYLATFDDKIEINQRINWNLYTQMRALTKQWIIKNTSDYEWLPLTKIASINPDTYSPKEEWAYVNYLDTSSITDGYIAEVQHITPSTEKLPSRARRKIIPNDIVFSTVRPNQRHFGILSEPMPNMLGSTGFAVIRSNHPLVCNELIYLCLTENEFIEKMQQLAEQSTSTFPSIKSSDLGVCEIPCPKDATSKGFFEMLKSMFALIAENQRENTSLATTRDALLPKLMSGELDISTFDL